MNKVLYSAFVVLCMFGQLQANSVGSNILVSVAAFSQFPTSDNGSLLNNNQVNAFAFMKNGFSLGDASTTCTFNSVFPVSGNINLHGGQLYLGTDLIFQNVTGLGTGGSIIGNGHVIDLCSSITGLPTVNLTKINNANVHLNDDLAISGTLKFNGNCTFDAHGNRVTLGSHGAMIVGHNTTLHLRDMTIDGVQGANIQCLDHTGVVIFDNIAWVQEGNYTFSNGAFQIYGLLDMVGTFTFAYQSTLTSTINHNATLRLEPTFTFSYDPGNYNPNLLTLIDNTSLLHINDATFYATKSGIQFINGKIIADGLAHIAAESTSIDTGLLIGNNNGANDIILQFNAASTLMVNKGYFAYQNINQNSIIINDFIANLNFQPGTTLDCIQNVNLEQASVYISTSATIVNEQNLNSNVTFF